MIRRTAILLLTLVLLPLAPAGALQLKVATLAPADSLWGRQFTAFVRQVAEDTDGAVTFKVYPGGVMGDDRAMYRKLRIGQIQGAGITVTGLAEIVPDFRVLSIPFLFRNYDEVDAAWETMLPHLRRQCQAKGLELAAITEVGFVYTLSTRAIATPAALAASRCWVPSGDPLSRLFLETAGATVVPLPLPEVLTALETGMVETVFNGSYGAIVLQWFTRTGFITDIPFGYAYGGLVFSRRAMDRLAPAHRAVLEKAARTHLGDSLRRQTRTANDQALATLRDERVTTVATDDGAQAAFAALRDQTVAKARGTLFSDQAYQLLAQALTHCRRQAGEPR